MATTPVSSDDSAAMPERPTVADALRQGWPAAATQAELHWVSGKGGTGKTTVAAGLALALAAAGKKVLLVEVEERQGIARLFDRSPLPYAEELLARVDGGGTVHGLAIDITEAMLEYLAMFYRLGFAGKAMRSVGAIEFATTIAPGLRDVLLTGKVKECVTRKADANGRVYDAVVVDSPPTGRIGKFLDVTSAMADLASSGPIRSQADGVSSLIHSPRTIVHLVTLLETLPVQETIEAVAELEGLDLTVGAIIVNRAAPRYLDDEALIRLSDEHIAADEVTAGLSAANLDPGPEGLAGLLVEGIEYARVATAQQQSVKVLMEQPQHTMVLGHEPEGIDVGALYDIAASLVEQGVR